MDNWQEDQLNSLQDIECEHELFKVVTALAHDLGFDHCAYGLRIPFPFADSQSNTILLNNYSAEWQKTYAENDYLAIDPTVHHGLTSISPVIWSNKLFASARNLWEDARSFDLNIGWAQAVHDPNGSVGMLSLSRSHESLTDIELIENKMKLAWLTQTTHVGISRILNISHNPEQLTPREREILRWTADGKTSHDISDILNISERTVNFHINNSVKKLDARNKLAATVKAATLGLLY